MGEDDQPEGELIAAFGALVSQALLGQPGTRPAAEHFEQVQMRLGNAPGIRAGAAFVAGIDRVGEQRERERIRRDLPRIKALPIQGDDRQHQQSGEQQQAQQTFAPTVAARHDLPLITHRLLLFAFSPCGNLDTAFHAVTHRVE